MCVVVKIFFPDFLFRKNLLLLDLGFFALTDKFSLHSPLSSVLLTYFLSWYSDPFVCFEMIYSINIQTCIMSSVLEIHYLHLRCFFLWPPPASLLLCVAELLERYCLHCLLYTACVWKSEPFQPGFCPTTWSSWSHTNPLRLLQFFLFCLFRS